MTLSAGIEQDGVETLPVRSRGASRLPWRDGVCIAVVLAFALIMCRPVFEGKVPVAADTLRLWSPWAQSTQGAVHNVALADSGLLFLPWATFTRNAIADGEWPMWDPYSFSGFPFAANSQNQVYYPVTWLLWLLPLAGAFQVLAIFNICLAGWGMYFYCRVLGTSRTGAMVAGLAFCGSGTLQTALELPAIASVYSWLPWMLLTSEMALRTRRAQWMAAAALCCGLEAVAGHLQWVIYSYFALGCWLVVRSLQLAWKADNRARRIDFRALRRALLRSVAILLGGLALASVPLSSFIELAERANRSGIRVSSTSESLSTMLRMLLPGFFGSPMVVPNYPLLYNNLWYVGVAPIILAAVGVFARPRTVALFWGAMSLLAFVVAYGIGPFLYVRWLPGLQATLPARIGFLMVAGLSVLAALGVDSWLALAARRGWAGLAALVVLALAVGYLLYIPLQGWLHRSSWTLRSFAAEYDPGMRHVQATEIQVATVVGAATLSALALMLIAKRTNPAAWTIAQVVVVAIAGIDLLTVLPDYNSYVEPQALRPGTPGVRWLRQQGGIWRMMPVDSPNGQPSFVPNSHLIFNFQSVDGYDSLHDSRYDDLWGLVDPSVRPKPHAGPYDNIFVRPQVYSSTVASLLGVNYVVMADGPAPAGMPRVFKSEVSTYENPKALPRAFLVARAETLPAGGVLQRLVSPDFDPRTEALLEGDASGAGEQSPPAQAAGTPGIATITSYRRNSVDVRVDASEDAYLVLDDVNYPGWHVSVDGQERPLLTADYILRAVRVSQGDHTVRFWFLPTYFVPAMALTLVVLAVVLSGLGWPILGMALARRPSRS